MSEYVCGECGQPIEPGQPVGRYDGARCHLDCAAQAQDAEQWDDERDE